MRCLPAPCAPLFLLMAMAPGITDPARGAPAPGLGQELLPAAPAAGLLEPGPRAARATDGPDPASIGPDEWRALEQGVRDLIDTFGEGYPRGRSFLERTVVLRRKGAPARGDFEALRREALLANPLLDFERLLVVRRSAEQLGLPMNWESNSSLPQTGYDNEIATLAVARGDGKLTTLFRPEGGRFVGDVDLHFDADRLLFSTPGANGRWQVHELRLDDRSVRELPLIAEPDVDNYDACYLPDGSIVFSSTAPFVGVPCVRGASHVTNLYKLSPDGSIRQLTVDQEHDWCPTVLGDGRILYQRWEYTDTPHAFYRLLFHMNPDGTGQAAFYGSNSYWPNALFYARPVPGHPSKVVAIVGGHHDLPRMGELVLFDVARGRQEAQGAVQRIPGWGRRVKPILRDGLTTGSWPKLLHPFPLSEKHFLVACKPGPDSLWGIYLADIFDNLLLLCEEPGFALLEPLPLRKMPRPPILAERVDRTRSDATVYLADVYAGAPMRGVPRGTVKRLRVVSYQFAYYGMGGQIDRVGFDGPWDVRRILGTVPVEEDGSARFTVPAYTPISLQPLDGEGKAVQLMRSWFTAMPGEQVSCAGCHDRQNQAPPCRPTLASLGPPASLEPWRGPPRGFSFEREVQPVIDRLCLGCHDGRVGSEGSAPPDLTRREPVHLEAGSPDYNAGARFSPSYLALRRLVRSPTIESDLRGLPPWEFHADTTRLLQLLRKGHHGVELDVEAWDRIVTWIDLHTPAHGTWTEICGDARVRSLRDRRRALRRLTTGMDEDLEAIPASLPSAIPAPLASGSGDGRHPGAEGSSARLVGSPSQGAVGGGRQASVGLPLRALELGSGVVLELVRVPAGEVLLGSLDGEDDERPVSRVILREPFWMGRFEVTNEQFALFDPGHSSRLEHGDFLQFDERERGYALDGPKQPVVRVSWLQAVAFSAWLSERVGEKVTLPTEAQWEYACRAGTTTPLEYGGLDDDFAPFANVSDATHASVDTFGWGLPSGAIPSWRPADVRHSDGFRVSAPVGSFQPNAWGLCDLHGNVAEWTLSSYRPYPYREGDGRDSAAPEGLKVVRGGSWYDRPARCRSAFRQPYLAHQGVYDVGFRVICAVDTAEQ